MNSCARQLVAGRWPLQTCFSTRGRRRSVTRRSSRPRSRPFLARLRGRSLSGRATTWPHFALRADMLRSVIVAALLASSTVHGQRARPTITRIDQLARSQVDSGFRGVVLVAQDDSILLLRAYAPPCDSLSVDQPFWIASMTKAFTAAAVLRLEEDGRLAVTDSIGRFFPDAPPDKRAITLQHLLTHTAGLGGEYSGGGIGQRARAVAAILSAPLIHKPGDGYRYGNDDYELLAAIVEV